MGRGFQKYFVYGRATVRTATMSELNADNKVLYQNGWIYNIIKKPKDYISKENVQYFKILRIHSQLCSCRNTRVGFRQGLRTRAAKNDGSRIITMVVYLYHRYYSSKSEGRHLVGEQIFLRLSSLTVRRAGHMFSGVRWSLGYPNRVVQMSIILFYCPSDMASRIQLLWSAVYIGNILWFEGYIQRDKTLSESLQARWISGIIWNGRICKLHEKIHELQERY